MGFALTDILLFGKTTEDTVDNGTLRIYRRNIMRWRAVGQYVTVIVHGTSPLSLPDAAANTLAYLKAFGGTEQRNLPDGYIERQFIYMMDGSYLLTDIVPTYDGHYELDFQTTTISSNPAAYLGGRADQSPAGLIFSHGSGVPAPAVADAFGQRYSLTHRPESNTRYKYVFNNKVFTLYKDGEVVETYTFTSTNNSGAALAIKAINTADTIDFANEGIYLYGFKAWNAQGELIADYVPAVQKGTVPVVGFYDTVSKTFKTATAGTFAAGGEAVPTPDAPMDIVCNNGVLKYGVLGKNLFDVNNVTIQADTSIGSDGSLIPNVATKVCMTYLPVKPNTTYTISGDVLGSDTVYFRLAQYKSDKTFLGRSADSTGQRSSYTFTTGADTYFVRFHCITEANLNTYQLELGSTATSYEPYRAGIYADGTVETINVHGKNLFDKEQTYISAFVNSNTGVLTEASPNQRSFVVGCLPNTTYTLSGMTAASGWGSFTSSTIGTTATSFTTGNGTITTGANDKYLIGLAYVQGSSSYDYRNALQIELGSTATTYENYFNGGTATAEMLLKVGNYEDVQSIIDGVVTRNVGVKVFDGTEDWTYNNYAFLVDLIGRLPQKKLMFCTHFNYDSGSSTMIPNLCIGGAGTTNTIFIKYQTYSTAEQFKQYLAAQYANGTPVTVVYPLATPTTESVAGQAMQVQQGDNIVEITQASLDNLELEAKYQAAVSLTIQEVQDANLDPNVQVTIN